MINAIRVVKNFTIGKIISKINLLYQRMSSKTLNGIFYTILFLRVYEIGVHDNSEIIEPIGT